MGEGFFSKFKELVGIEEIDDDEDMEEEVAAAPERRPMDGNRPANPPRQENGRDNRVVAMPPGTKTGPATIQFKLVVTEPQGFDECPKLVDSLKARKPIIINLEKVETDVARKMFDFLSGATYALNGNVQKVSSNIFVFAPESVEVTTGGQDNRTFLYTETVKSPWR